MGSTITTANGVVAPLPERGDILMGRPIFSNESGDWALGPKEHPMIVLKTFTRGEGKHQRTMAIVVPMTHSESALRSPTALPITGLQVRHLKAHDGKQSHIVADSPNVIVLDGPNNGVRPRDRAPSWASPLVFGRVTDPYLLDAVEKITKSFVETTGYQPPIQGAHAGDHNPKHRHAAKVQWSTRKTVVAIAAEQAAKASMAALERMTPALLRAGLPKPSLSDACATR